MKRLVAGLRMVGTILAIAVVVVFLLCYQVDATYEGVKSDLGVKADLLYTHSRFAFAPPDHIVSEGKLYLRRYARRYFPSLIGGLQIDDWDELRLHAFRAAYPELEGYWPNPARPDGGVRWVKGRQN